MKKLFIALVLLLAPSCTWNFSNYPASQKNFHEVNADNQVYYEYIRHTTYPGTSTEDYCNRLNKIPNHIELSSYGSITEECRGKL